MTDGSSVTTRGREVVNIHTGCSVPLQPTPEAVFKSRFKLTVYSVPPAIAGSG